MQDEITPELRRQIASELARSGGKARQAAMTPAQRRAHALAMLEARWHKKSNDLGNNIIKQK